ncbi:putative dehydrogenases [Staphylococcus petrasii]|uniref:Putative dehydrogenases n=1 Tax=Staphylococcus petrasii TaxID=1276936 RepID=A0A380G517_9STAP|nr:rhodanese-like domain-containing protein [Staphylococcus petrasii]PNZ30852.1 sulfurtransferase [Staphylococcus petrasii]TGE11091.1 rhodanese-like domain-containing protein [Staphylococcus petrasii]TGE16480.1 rhodanese-like domain-containing protein [Staphylococcus petrasii]SUM45071.1 putative dehydrogenases [Staphylococcus petrasii]
MNKIEFLETFLSLYINHHVVLEDMEKGTNKYIVLDVRNAPKKVKKDKIKGSIEIPAKDLREHLSELSKNKVYVVYDWTGGTILGKQALLELYNNGFEAYELAGALEGWKGMSLPLENVE